MKQIFLLLATLLLFATPLLAEDTPVPTEIAAPAFPGLAEVLPRFAKLSEEGQNTEIKLVSLREAGAFRDQLEAVRKRQKSLAERTSGWGEPGSWTLDRLLDARSWLIESQSALKKLLEALSNQLGELEKISQDWESRKGFWGDWKTSLAGRENLPVDTFDKARALAQGLIAEAERASIPFVDLQREVTELQEQALQAIGQIEQATNTLRTEIFKKTSRSFASRAFYTQFADSPWQSVRDGIRSVHIPDAEFFQTQGWVMVLQLLIALTLGLSIIHYRQRDAVTAEWQFILHRPWATGLFVALSGLGFLYTSPPALWRFVLWTVAAFSASLLIASLLRNPRKIFMVYLLATLFVFSLGLQVIAFPPFLYRIYLALLSLAGIPALLWMARSNIRAHEGRADSFTLYLRLGAVILLLAFFAQFGGFSNFASRLIESSIKTVFLGLFAAMAVRLGRGGIDFVLGLETLHHRHFFKRFGNELAGRLKGAFLVVVILYALLNLLVIWGVFDGVGQAWEAILDASFTWGETTISLHMILLAALVLYASVVTSWVISSVLETELFPRQGMDRGLRDSIRTLLRYALIFIGFLLALSLTGLEMRNFAVLAGAFGIGIGFGLQNVVNNFVSGLILLFERPIKIGDTVVLDGEWGRVRKIGLRSTVVETLDNSEIIVPNSLLVSEKVTNWTLSTKNARVSVPIGVAYGSDVALVLKILLEAGSQVPEALSDPAPSPIFTGFGESSLDFELRVWIQNIDQRLRVKSDLCAYIDRRFREEGVEIPFPQRDLHLRSVDEKLLAAAKAPAGRENPPRKGPAKPPRKKPAPPAKGDT